MKCAPDFDVLTSRETALNIDRGASTEVVRVRWRRVGERRWASFLLVPDLDQSLDELEANALLAVEAVASGKAARA